MLKHLLLTGAAGGVGQAIRPLLKTMAATVGAADIVPVGALRPHVTYQACELADRDAVSRLIEGVDGILHLGGISVEQPFDAILQANILGTYNLFEGARHHGRPRIIFASSNHVVGFYRRDERVDASAPPRPDSLYGVSKVFGESLASLYFDKFGQECLSLRIGSCFPQPKNPRMLATWLAVEDLADLCACAFSVPRLGHTIIYGMSDNDEVWWDNRAAAFLGWKPQRSSSRWRDEILAATNEDPADPAVIYQGGGFAGSGHPED